MSFKKYEFNINIAFFKKLWCLCFILLNAFLSGAQQGCTDHNATNYDPAAKINNGSCLYPVTHATLLIKGTFPNTIISESSGLVWSDGKLWTHNDSGNPDEIYSIDTATGDILQTLIIDNYPNTDWEDIAADSNYIYVGNFGNNNGNRTDLKILKVAKADITNGSVVHANAQAISFSYSDQTTFVPSSTHNFDCEALISIKDSLYIFTKDRGDLQTRVYKLPKTPGTYMLSPYTNFNVNGLITGADYDPKTKEIALVGYFSGHANSFLWFLTDYQGDNFFSGNKRRIEIGNGNEWQTEGICYFTENRFLVSCENAGTYPSSFFVGSKAWVSTINSVDEKGNNTCMISPNPVKDRLFLQDCDDLNSYSITDILGRQMKVGGLINGEHQIDVSWLTNGAYFIVLQKDKVTAKSIKVIKE